MALLPRALLRRRRPRPATTRRALLLALVVAAATTQRCSTSLGWALGSAGHAPLRRAPLSAAALFGSRVPRASRGGEASEVDGGEAEGTGFPQISFDRLEVGQAVKVRAEFTGTEPRPLTFSMRSQCAKLQVGQKLTGTVRNIEDFGAFVDVGAECSGLLPMSNVAEERVDEIQDYLTVGQEIEVWVSKVRKDGKFDLTMIQSKVPPKLEVGQKHTGVVRHIEDFGAFVDLSAELSGLLHRSNVAEQLVDDIHDYLEVGQEVEVWVSKVHDDGTFALTMVQSKLPVKFEVGQKLTGIVTQILDFGAFVDVGATAAGLLHVSNVAEQRVDDVHDHLKVGQEVEVWVSRVREDGKLDLTMVQSKIGLRQHKSVDAERGPVKLQVGQKYTGTVRQIEDFGAFVDVGTTRNGLLHRSSVAEQPVDDIHDHLKVGQEVEVWVSAVHDDGKFALTMVQSKICASVPVTLQVGQKRTGIVRQIEDFGAFVDIGTERSGLLHISNVAEERVDDIQDYLKVGQEVEVWVSKVHDDGRIDLTTVQSKLPLKLEVGQKLAGIVRRIEDFGAFVDIGAQRSGLLHISNVAKQPVDDIHDYLIVGQEVEVWVSRVREDGKLDLTLVQSKLPLMLRVGQKLAGIVRRIEDFGAFVDIGAERSGLLHRSSFGEQPMDDIHDYLKVGQEVEVWVSSVREDGKVDLTMFQSKLLLQPRVGQKLAGVVRRIEDFGAFVDIGATGIGLLHRSNVAEERVDDVQDYLRVGQEVEVWVSEVRDDGRFELTMVQSSMADDSAFAGVSPDVWLDATVVRMKPAGAIVSVSPPSGGAAQERFVPASRIKAGGLEVAEAGDDGAR